MPSKSLNLKKKNHFPHKTFLLREAYLLAMYIKVVQTNSLVSNLKEILRTSQIPCLILNNL